MPLDSVDPSAIRAWVLQYNWDDGLAPMWPLIQNPRTERGTALLIYWRMEGPFFEGEEGEGARFHSEVEQKLKAGFFEGSAIRYDPVEDNQLSKVALYKLRKAGVPEVLLSPV